MTQQSSLCLIDSALELLDALVEFLDKFLTVGDALPEVLSVEAAGKHVHLYEGELCRVGTSGDLPML